MSTPGWLDRTLYPFESRYLDTGEGRIHYVDEGQGDVILMVHGTPTWSFLYRDLIRRLSATHRVVAPDHLGFGLSDKPEGAAYRPADHARRLALLIDRLELRDFTLVVHDFGGPIGLSYALDHPDRVARLVLFNTWLWSIAGEPAKARVARIMGGPLGRFLYRRLNFSPRVLVKSAYGDRSRLTPVVHRHYTAPFPTPATRQAPWVLAREMLGSSDWYESLWRRLDRLAGKPTLIVWGMKDPAFPPSDLARWEEALPGARVVRLDDVGHFVPDEAPDAAAREIEAFIAERGPAAGRASGAG